jgi:hypothetical protein
MTRSYCIPPLPVIDKQALWWLSGHNTLLQKGIVLMKKCIAAMVSVLVLGSTAAHAEHKLLVTDVLDLRQFEAEATMEYSRTQASFHTPAEGGRIIRNSTESRYTLGAGLGHGLEVNVSVPYVLAENSKVQFNDPATPSEFENKSGFGDISLGAKYAIIPEHHGSVALTAGLDVKLDSARRKDAGTGTTDISPFLAVSKDLGHHTTPYASYSLVISNHDHADEHILKVGLEKQFNDIFTLDANVSADFATATKRVSSSEAYTAELVSYIQVARNLYVLPSVFAGFGSRAHSKDIDLTTGSPFAAGGSVSLYYLFQ